MQGFNPTAFEADLKSFRCFDYTLEGKGEGDFCCKRNRLRPRETSLKFAQQILGQH